VDSSFRRAEVLLGRPVGQVGIVVHDLESALERYSDIWGLGPWRCWTYGPATVPHLTYRDEPGRFVLRIALTGESPQVELLQPVAGPSIFDEWVESRREGLHHLAVMVESLDAAIASVEAAGYPVLQSGRGYGLDGDGGFAYFDTQRALGLILEAIEVPRRRREPDLIWPP